MFFKKAGEWVSYQRENFRIYINGVAETYTAKGIVSVASGSGLALTINSAFNFVAPFVPQSWPFSVARYTFVSITFIFGTVMASAEIDLSVTAVSNLKKENEKLQKTIQTLTNNVKYLKKEVELYDESMDLITKTVDLTEDDLKELTAIKERRKTTKWRRDSLEIRVTEQRDRIQIKNPLDIELDTFKEYSPQASINSTRFFSSSSLLKDVSLQKQKVKSEETKAHPASPAATGIFSSQPNQISSLLEVVIDSSDQSVSSTPI